VCGQHQVLSGEAGVRFGNRSFRFGIDDDQHRRVVKNVEGLAGQRRPVALEQRVLIHGVQEKRLGPGRVLLKLLFVGNNGEGPRLGVHGAGRLGRQGDEFFDESPVHAAILVAADGTPRFEHLYQIHSGSVLSLHCGGYVFSIIIEIDFYASFFYNINRPPGEGVK